jgi:hypothetical protein
MKMRHSSGIPAAQRRNKADSPTRNAVKRQALNKKAVPKDSPFSNTIVYLIYITV